MLKRKAHEEYAKWWDYWMSKIPQNPISVQHSPANKDSNLQFSEKRASLLRQAKGVRPQRNLAGPESDRNKIGLQCIGLNASQSSKGTDVWDD